MLWIKVLSLKGYSLNQTVFILGSFLQFSIFLNKLSSYETELRDEEEEEESVRHAAMKDVTKLTDQAANHEEIEKKLCENVAYYGMFCVMKKSTWD